MLWRALISFLHFLVAIGEFTVDKFQNGKRWCAVLINIPKPHTFSLSSERWVCTDTKPLHMLTFIYCTVQNWQPWPISLAKTGICSGQARQGCLRQDLAYTGGSPWNFYQEPLNYDGCKAMCDAEPQCYVAIHDGGQRCWAKGSHAGKEVNADRMTYDKYCCEMKLCFGYQKNIFFVLKSYFLLSFFGPKQNYNIEHDTMIGS